MKLTLEEPKFYRVKQGQSLQMIARVFRIPPRVLAEHNRLTGEPPAGSVLELPAERHDLYLVQGRESKTLLCGSKEAFESRNRTPFLFPGQLVWL